MHVAERSPFTLDYKRVEPAQWNELSDKTRPEHARYFKTNPEPMVSVFKELAVPSSKHTNDA
ncbi:MAG TPA: hypothetical protein H9830_01640, partial [Candidatus Agrococcus pullicola]|nr:hypothetical protein [Candidatus Agrococcus pullicola]